MALCANWKKIDRHQRIASRGNITMYLEVLSLSLAPPVTDSQQFKLKESQGTQLPCNRTMNNPVAAEENVYFEMETKDATDVGDVVAPGAKQLTSEN